MAIRGELRAKLLDILKRSFPTVDSFRIFVSKIFDMNLEDLSTANRLRAFDAFLDVLTIDDAGQLIEALRALKSGSDVRRILDSIDLRRSGQANADLCFNGGQPFVNRDDLQTKLESLLPPDGKKILIVDRGPGNGNSHARDRIERLARRHGFSLIDIRLREYADSRRTEIGPFDLGQAITLTMDLELSKDLKDPKEARWAVNFLHWLAGKVDSGQQWWIVIDDFEPHKIEVPTSVYDFIGQISERLNGVLSPLRLVLLSFDRKRVQPPLRALIAEEKVDPISDWDLVDYFIRFYRDHLPPGDPKRVVADARARAERVRKAMTGGDQSVLLQMRDAIIKECDELLGRGERAS